MGDTSKGVAMKHTQARKKICKKVYFDTFAPENDPTAN
jgi:hypothetical protein